MLNTKEIKLVMISEWSRNKIRLLGNDGVIRSEIGKSWFSENFTGSLVCMHEDNSMQGSYFSAGLEWLSSPVKGDHSWVKKLSICNEGLQWPQGRSKSLHCVLLCFGTPLNSLHGLVFLHILFNLFYCVKFKIKSLKFKSSNECFKWNAAVRMMVFSLDGKSTETSSHGRVGVRRLVDQCSLVYS